jgi:hypothetical protein
MRGRKIKFVVYRMGWCFDRNGANVAAEKPYKKLEQNSLSNHYC